VIDRKCGGYPHSYIDFLAEFWGREDMIILEDDKVPTMLDLARLADCPAWSCVFPYRFNTYLFTTMRKWQRDTPCGIGFVKFSKAAQLAHPVSEWLKTPDALRVPEDRIIVPPLVAKFGPRHVHPEAVKHNHGRGVFVYGDGILPRLLALEDKAHGLIGMYTHSEWYRYLEKTAPSYLL
jgi:hypothetical protein